MESFSEFVAFNEDAGKRIDVFLTERCQGYSRKHLQQILQEGEVEINGKKAKKIAAAIPLKLIFLKYRKRNFHSL